MCKYQQQNIAGVPEAITIVKLVLNPIKSSNDDGQKNLFSFEKQGRLCLIRQRYSLRVMLQTSVSVGKTIGIVRLCCSSVFSVSKIFSARKINCRYMWQASTSKGMISNFSLTERFLNEADKMSYFCCCVSTSKFQQVLQNSVSNSCGAWFCSI